MLQQESRGHVYRWGKGLRRLLWQPVGMLTGLGWTMTESRWGIGGSLCPRSICWSRMAGPAHSSALVV